ncbi:helix-hairpin-helix domain-containing protein [Fibrobacter sp.]|uniref:ComEA family DNA-binding protein n=1 Tax=Fibrobacter sp. TaxID=35828 RepID=UPI0025C25FD2|nr:helix-hairpin-helix domain-containing protein [Fibrobacter sp.]MBR3072273.1 helix-hairpin-helix domain-containing protein [Fibrobacter sp.]
MNVSEKRIIKLAIILFTIGLVFRYFPWGLPSIESFEVGEAFVVANASSPLLEKDVPDTIASADSGDVVNKINTSTELVQTIDQAGAVQFENHRKPKKKVVLPLHINTASVDDLCALKGVGPKLAEKIIERRNAAGPFKGPSDLKKVHGIGKKKLENMLQSIIFD